MAVGLEGLPWRERKSLVAVVAAVLAVFFLLIFCFLFVCLERDLGLVVVLALLVG